MSFLKKKLRNKRLIEVETNGQADRRTETDLLSTWKVISKKNSKVFRSFYSESLYPGVRMATKLEVEVETGGHADS